MFLVDLCVKGSGVCVWCFCCVFVVEFWRSNTKIWGKRRFLSQQLLLFLSLRSQRKVFTSFPSLFSFFPFFSHHSVSFLSLRGNHLQFV